jgi:arylsulfatase A-like enzyme
MFFSAIFFNSCERAKDIPNDYPHATNLIPIAVGQGAEAIPVIAGRLMHFTEEFEALPLTKSEDGESYSLTLRNIQISDRAILSFSYFPPPPVLKAGPMTLSVRINSKENRKLILNEYRIRRRPFFELLDYVREKWQIFYNYIDFYRHFTLDLSQVAGQAVDIQFTVRAPVPFADDQAAYEKWSGSHMPTPFAVCNPVIYSPGVSPDKTPINVLCIIVDALRADAVGAYGYNRATTPNIDGVAAEGLMMRRAYSPSNFTRGSITAMFTGRYASTLGIPLARWDLTQAEKMAFRVLTSAQLSAGAFPDSLPRRLLAEDYVVEHIGSNPFIQDGTAIGSSLGFTRVVSFNQRSRDTEAIAAHSMSFLERNSRRPFFLAVHFNNGHGPLRPPRRFQKIFDDPIENDPRIWSALYDGEIRYADEKIGLMMESLRRLGIEKNTLVVICADHGQGFETGHPKGHAHSLYDGETRVPFIMRLPEILPAGKVLDAPVSLLDIYPTFLAAAGESPLGMLDGKSLINELRPKAIATDLYLEGAGVRALVSNDKKSIVKDGPYERMRGREPADRGRFGEFYDLGEDPSEKANAVAPKIPEQKAMLTKLRELKIARAQVRFDQVEKLSKMIDGANTLYSESAHESVRLLFSAGEKDRIYKGRLDFDGKPDSIRCYDCEKQQIFSSPMDEEQSDSGSVVDFELEIKAGQTRRIGFTPWPPDARFTVAIECDGELLNPNHFYAGPYKLPFTGNPAKIGGLNDYVLMSDVAPPDVDPKKEFGVFIRYASAVTKAKIGVGGQVKDALKSWGYVK